jgi:hypothetical protein
LHAGLLFGSGLLVGTRYNAGTLPADKLGAIAISAIIDDDGSREA